MIPEIEAFINSKHIAVVGVSRQKRKFGNIIFETLQKRGFQVYPVNPEGSFFGSPRCYRSLEDVPDDVKAAVISTRPSNAMAVVESAIRRQFEILWFQQGGDFAEAAAAAQKAGLKVVTGRCVLLYAPPVTGIHALHRFLARITKRL